MKILLKRLKTRMGWLKIIAVYAAITFCNLLSHPTWIFQLAATSFIIIFILPSMILSDKAYDIWIKTTYTRPKQNTHTQTNAEQQEKRILLNKEDFKKLTAGDVLEKDNVKIALQDIGYVQMINIVEEHLNKM